MIDYFHCIPDSTSFLSDHPGQFDVLTSAYRIKRYSTIKRSLKYARRLFLDSGMLSAWNAGKIDWASEQDYVVRLANEIKPDLVAMLDLPMEPHLLAANGVTSLKALNKTKENAMAFMEAHLPQGTKKVYVVQGYELSEYQQCLDWYRELGIFDSSSSWIAIGSVCKRSPRMGLYQVAKFIRKEVKHHHIHAFGIGRRAWIRELVKIGIDSFDSATASMTVAYNKGESQVKGRHRNIDDRDRQFAFEFKKHEDYLNAAPIQGELF